MIVLNCLAVVIALAIVYLWRIYSRFSRYGVKHFRPIPFLGSLTRILLRYDHFVDDVMRMYNTFPEEKFVGSYEFFNELITIRDLELIKKIAVKDFEYFYDHRFNFSTNDSYFSRNLFSLKGKEWKNMRATLSPAFTGSKMRVMVPLMSGVGQNMTGFLQKKISTSESDYADIDCKELSTRYAVDVVASCVFGLNEDSYNDESSKFYALGKASSSFHVHQLLQSYVIGYLPTFAKIFKVDFLSDVSKKFFKKLTLETMADRDINNTIRPDMIHILMEARKVWTDDYLIAQAGMFFIAGVETTSLGMSFMLYELALNPDVQERLVQEIKDTDAMNGGKLDLYSIERMSYMDMVISEVLRKWPPGLAPDRVCTRDYNLGKPNEKAEKDFIVRKGTGVSIPVFAIHRDPKFYPNPDKFDPERFSPENKHKIESQAYMPFGVGPRNCIGTRFALCQMKVMAYKILQDLEISRCEKTTIPAKLDKETFNTRLEGGHWHRFKARK